MVVKEERNSRDFIAKKYKLVPPDGGYGYFVAFAAIVNLTTMTAFAGCFGMMYNEFLIEKGMGSASLTTLGGVYWMSAAFSGFFASPLLAVTSMRKVAFTAAVISTCGTFGTVVMTTPLMFYVFAGVMQGIGLGVLYNLTCTIINDYFVEKNLLMISFIQMATGLLSIFTPMLIDWLLDLYGSRGALLIIGGITMHSIVAVLMMQPVKWHMKKFEVDETEKAGNELLLIKNEELKNIPIPVVKLTDIEGFDIKEDTEKAIIDYPENHKKKSSIRKFLELFLDIVLLKTLLRSCVSFGIGMSITVDGTFAVILPQYLYSQEWTQENVAMALSVYGLGDLMTRVLFTIVSKWLVKLGTQRIYIAGLVLAALSRLGVLWTGGVTATMVFLTLAGSSHCFITTLIPVVISNMVAPEKFSSAMGICFFFNGVLSITCGPAIGAVRDITNSYLVAFYIVILLFVSVAVMWSIELIIKSKKQRRLIVKTNSSSSQLHKIPLS